jgi:hypothetical protein
LTAQAGRSILEMMRAVLIALLLAAAVAMVGGGGCLKRPTFECSMAAECTSANGGGFCVSGFCAFTDNACASGQRFGEQSGSLAGTCVPGAGGDADIPPDQTVTADARECFGSGLYQVCIDGAPMGDLDLAGNLDTTTDGRCVAPPAMWATAGQPDSCFLIGHQITVSATLTVIGTRPLVLIGGTIAVNASIDAASRRVANTLGPGANTAVCGVFGTNATDVLTAGASAAGGAGGTFITQGGIGGRAENDNGKPGGTPALAIPAPTLLRAGCPVQIGGDGPTATGGVPGAGGGAVMLAAVTITIGNNIHIDVSGAGGSATTGGGGGGGGGAGGMIVLFADTITATGANLLANGGAGASGSNNGAAAGQAGADPNPDDPNNAANGGTTSGGDGGDGFAGANPAKNAQSTGNNQAGGGGGGGAGFIQSNVTLAGATVSPIAVP